MAANDQAKSLHPHYHLFCLFRCLPSHHLPHSSIPPSVHLLSFLTAPGGELAHGCRGSVQGADSNSSLSGAVDYISPLLVLFLSAFFLSVNVLFLFSKLSVLTLLNPLASFAPFSIILPVASPQKLVRRLLTVGYM